MDKFKKDQFKSFANPYDYYNSMAVNDDDFEKDVAKNCRFFRIDGKKWMKVDQALYQCLKSTEGLEGGKNYNRYQILTAVGFKGNYKAATNYIETEYLNSDVPYIRVGTDYFKVIQKPSVYGVKLTELKTWNRETIVSDFGKEFADTRVQKYDDFFMEPDNIDYKPVVNGMYNLYRKFPHTPYNGAVSISDIPTTASLIMHVFGEQHELGWKYLKVMYEKPKQILPVLTLVSKERETGKTSLLNYMEILFGDNYIQIPPEDLVGNFNIAFADKNIIGIDEAVVDKQSAIEKIKSIATASTITVNAKYVNPYKVPFYGKLIITTNKERDFMRIDSEEIRFWVRKLGKVKKISVNFYDNLLDEIPKVLTYLRDQIEVEYGNSRMVFTAQELRNSYLVDVIEESYSGLKKELLMNFDEWFANNNADNLELTASDIKTHWFNTDNRIKSYYISKVMRDEMDLEPSKTSSSYSPFGGTAKSGRYFTITRDRFFTSKSKESESTKSKSDSYDNFGRDELPF